MTFKHLHSVKVILAFMEIRNSDIMQTSPNYPMAILNNEITFFVHQLKITEKKTKISSLGSGMMKMSLIGLKELMSISWRLLKNENFDETVLGLKFRLSFFFFLN